MARNVEIKARLTDLAEKIRIAEQLSGGKGILIEQEDIFFRCATGRFKLRIFSPTAGQLIHYHRPDRLEPTTSDYSIAEISDPIAMREVLSRSNGELAVVRKQRRLFLVGRTRIHLDSVEGLGDFLELEAVLRDGESVDGGAEEVATLMRALVIDPASLIDVAYVDQLANQSEERSANRGRQDFA